MKSKLDALVYPLAVEFQQTNAGLTQRSAVVSFLLWFVVGYGARSLTGSDWAILAFIPGLLFLLVARYVGMNKRAKEAAQKEQFGASPK